MTDPSDWTGRQFHREEAISSRMIAQFRATFPGLIGPGAVPPGFHWTLVPDLAEPSALGRDGHPRTGIFLPALPLPRRMWAGGEVSFLSDFKPEDHVTRDSTIGDIAFKQGGSGRLGFVTVWHDYSAGGVARLRERQDIVYREDPDPAAPAPAPRAAEPWPDAQVWTVTPDPVLLFRYSALTFNGHRIHYDHPYATAVEGYAGLVVHGPMQAVWMLNLAAHRLGRLPARFGYRGLAPLICGEAVRIEARETAEGMALRVLNAAGMATMSATAVA